MDMKLEVAVIPVSDVDRAKRFYGSLGWRLDADIAKGDAFRVVQFTPPGSQASIHFGKGVTTGADGIDPERRTYNSFASFNDPDGNRWLLQEITARLPGRVDASETIFTSSAGARGGAAARIGRARRAREAHRQGAGRQAAADVSEQDGHQRRLRITDWRSRRRSDLSDAIAPSDNAHVLTRRLLNDGIDRYFGSSRCRGGG